MLILAFGKGEENVGDGNCSVILNVFCWGKKLCYDSSDGLGTQLNILSNLFSSRWNTPYFKGALSLWVWWARKGITEGLWRYSAAHGKVPSRNLDSQPPAEFSHTCKFSSKTECAFFSSFHKLLHSHNLLQVKAKDFPILRFMFKLSVRFYIWLYTDQYTLACVCFYFSFLHETAVMKKMEKSDSCPRPLKRLGSGWGNLAPELASHLPVQTSGWDQSSLKEPQTIAFPFDLSLLCCYHELF